MHHRSSCTNGSDVYSGVDVQSVRGRAGSGIVPASPLISAIPLGGDHTFAIIALSGPITAT